MPAQTRARFGQQYGRLDAVTEERIGVVIVTLEATDAVAHSATCCGTCRGSRPLISRGAEWWSLSQRVGRPLTEPSPLRPELTSAISPLCWVNDHFGAAFLPPAPRPTVQNATGPEGKRGKEEADTVSDRINRTMRALRRKTPHWPSPPELLAVLDITPPSPSTARSPFHAIDTAHYLDPSV